MSYRITSYGPMRNGWRPLTTEQRHYMHWEWLRHLDDPKYNRVIRLWNRLYSVRPRGIIIMEGETRINFVRI